MKCLWVLIIALSINTLAQTNSIDAPDGNGLLENCRALISANDDPSSLLSLSRPDFDKAVSKAAYCRGFIDSTMGMVISLEMVSDYALKNGVEINGPEKTKSYFVDKIRPACVPDGVHMLQLARTTVKWLKDHPKELHKASVVLMIQAMHEGFPCGTLK